MTPIRKVVAAREVMSVGHNGWKRFELTLECGHTIRTSAIDGTDARTWADKEKPYSFECHLCGLIERAIQEQASRSLHVAPFKKVVKAEQVKSPTDFASGSWQVVLECGHVTTVGGMGNEPWLEMLYQCHACARKWGVKPAPKKPHINRLIDAVIRLQRQTVIPGPHSGKPLDNFRRALDELGIADLFDWTEERD